jgi:hypothetical protein
MKSYRYFPSTHHNPAFTGKYQVSTQLGAHNQHLAVSVTDRWAIRGSRFKRIVSSDNSWSEFTDQVTTYKTGLLKEYELGIGRYHPGQDGFYHQYFVGVGWGTTKYKFSDFDHSVNGNPYHFNSTNRSIFGQYMFNIGDPFDPNSKDRQFNVFVTLKSKWVALTKINGTLLNQPYDLWSRYSPTNKEDYLWLNDVSLTMRYRGKENDHFYAQLQTGVSLANKYNDAYRKLWIEFAVGLMLDINTWSFK